MEWKKKDLAGWVVVLALAVLAGCTSAPKQPENPYLGYVYYRAIKDNPDFKQDGVDDKLRDYAKEIAKLEFQKRQNKFPGIQRERSLTKSKNYFEALKKPVVIEERQWKGAAESSLKKKGRRAVEAYWAKNHPISFYGDKVLSQWGDTRDNLKSQIRSDTQKATAAEDIIEGLRGRKKFRDALKKVEELSPYKPSDAKILKKDIKREASTYWAGQRLAELDELKAVRPYDGAHEQRVMDLFDKVNEDVKAFGHREAFNGVYNGWMTLLGENWRARIVQLGADKEYWEAYGFVWERYHDYVDTVRFAETYRKGLKLAINKGYLEILDNAIRYYRDLASKNTFKNNHGKAYVYCCMAKEMYDFVAVAGIDYAGENAEKYYHDITDLEKDELMPALDARVARRLVVHDCEPDVDGMAKSLRKQCLERFSALGNDLAWGLEVVMDKVALAQLEQGDLPIKPEDYVVEWANAGDIEVDVTQEPARTRRALVKTDRIKLVNNPNEFRKDKTSKFYKHKKRWAQEVSLYSLTDTKLSLDLSCDIKVSCRHRGAEETLKLPATEKAVAKYNKDFGSGTNTEAELFLSNVSDEMKYYTEDTPKNAIPTNATPKSVKFSLPDEDRIRAGLVTTIASDLADELEGLIEVYPIELLADVDVDNTNQYHNALGTVLYYVAKLSEAEAAKRKSAGFNYEWLPLRDQINYNMEKWCGAGGRWFNAGSKTEILKNLWDECIKMDENVKAEDKP